MTHHLQTWCHTCQRPFCLKAVAGNFFWCCECPPMPTYATNNARIPVTSRPPVLGKIQIVFITTGHNETRR